MPQRSTINLLPEDIRAWLNEELVRNGFSDYEDLASQLFEKGYEISKSALHRYGQKYEEQLFALREVVEQARGLVEVCKDDEGSLPEAVTMLLYNKSFQALQKIDVGTLEVSASSITFLGSMIANLNKSSIALKKYRTEVKKKIEEKLKLLEAEAIKAGGEGDENPHLKTLKRVREEVYGLF
ncbi:DUF3486 family protein [Anabaena sp. PCC 7108]|uniref:DUF3486 family protein n=1 Tax=Anabaena sp. PCC 7108 TaxID=163908 RepID=UPI000346D047|nr:DUF3486 family protein [Anabaena sp. PCC 7108]